MAVSDYQVSSTEDETEPKPPSGKSKKKLLKTLLAQYKKATEAISEQAKREEEDLEFQVPEKQWDESAKRERQGFAVAGVPSPPRPCLSVSKIQQPIDQILNQERAAHLGVNIHPRGPDADEETAEVQQSLYRRIEASHPPANVARSWAYDRAVKVGRGFYRVGTEYDETSSDKFDQGIKIQRILYQNMVYFDPAAMEADLSDANYCFVGSWVNRTAFKKQWPKASWPTGEGELTPVGGDNSAQPEWVRGLDDDDDLAECLVMEGWYKETDYETIQSDADDEVSRVEETVTLWYCKFTADEFLEGPRPENGKYIPIVPVIGKELQPFKGKRIWQGIISVSKDGQRMFNWAASSVVERGAIMSKAPYLLDPEQIQGYEAWWQQANTRNLPYLPYHSKADSAGNAIAPPQRNPADGSGIEAMLMVMQQAASWVEDSTAQFDPGLGRTNNRERSGKAITALQQQGDLANSNFLYNLADVAMQYEARVVLDKMQYVYDRPGRIVQIMDSEDKSSLVMLNHPFVEHPEQGPLPVQMQPGQPMPTSAQVPGMPQKLPVKMFDLSKGLYSATVSIGKSYQSRNDEGSEQISKLIEAIPNIAPLILPTWMKFQSWPGSKEVSELLLKARDKQFPFLAQGEPGEPPTPEQAQAQIQQLQAQNQQLHQGLQQAGQIIQTKQTEQQGKLQQVQLQNQSKEKIASQKNQTDLVLEKMSEMAQLIKQMMADKHDAGQAVLDQVHDGALASAQQAHEQVMPGIQAQAQTQAQPAIAPYTTSMNQGLPEEEPL